MGIIKHIKKFVLSTRIFAFLLLIAFFISPSCRFSNKTRVSEEANQVPDTLVSIEDSDTLPEINTAQMITPISEDPDDLMEFMRASENWEAYKTGILPLMIEKSPEYTKKLLNNIYSGFIAVDKSRMKVILFDKFGNLQKSYGMACAKNYGTKHEKGDSRTPEGFFSVEGIYDSTDWLFTDDNGVTSKKKGQFGPRFIRLRIPGTSQIGIHGTCAPWSIGARASHGCIRITNENILELVDLVEIGMPVIVIPGRKDIEQNIIEGYDIPWIPTSATAKEPKIKQDKTVVPEILPDSVPLKDTLPEQVIDTTIELEKDTANNVIN